MPPYDIGNGAVIALTAHYVSGGAVAIQTPTGSVEVDSSWPHWAEMLTSGLYIRPEKPEVDPIAMIDWFIWTGPEDNTGYWVVDQSIFTPKLEEDMSQYRDWLIDNESIVELEWDNGVTQEMLGLLADERTKRACGDKSNLAPVRDSDGLIEYKFKTFDVLVSPNGYRDVSSGFMQEFYEALDDKQQTFFSAEKYVLGTHAATPYTSIVAARADFDNYLAGL